MGQGAGAGGGALRRISGGVGLPAQGQRGRGRRKGQEGRKEPAKPLQGGRVAPQQPGYCLRHVALNTFFMKNSMRGDFPFSLLLLPPLLPGMEMSGLGGLDPRATTATARAWAQSSLRLARPQPRPPSSPRGRGPSRSSTSSAPPPPPDCPRPRRIRTCLRRLRAPAPPCPPPSGSRGCRRPPLPRSAPPGGRRGPRSESGGGSPQHPSRGEEACPPAQEFKTRRLLCRYYIS